MSGTSLPNPAKTAIHPAVQCCCLASVGVVVLLEAGAYRLGSTLLPLLAMLLVGLNPARMVSLILWLMLFVAASFQILAHPFEVANHHYLAGYLGLAMLLSMTHASPSACFRNNARWLIAGVLLFAVLQKCFSAEFMSGAYPGYMLVTGIWGKYILPFILAPEVLDQVIENNSVVNSLLSSKPVESQTMVLFSPVEALNSVSYGFSAGILMLEGLLLGLVVMAPEARSTFLTLVLFLMTVTVVRPELAFASILAALCAGLYGHRFPRRTVCFTILSILLILVEVCLNHQKGLG